MTKWLEHLKAKIRARVEHAFRVIKQQFGFQKARYRGLAKNNAQLHTLFALSSLWMLRGEYWPTQGSCASEAGNLAAKRRKRRLKTIIEVLVAVCPAPCALGPCCSDDPYGAADF